MQVIVKRFIDGRLKLLIRFEEDTNFRPKTLTWVPRKDEVKLIDESLKAIDGYNVLAITDNIMHSE